MATPPPGLGPLCGPSPQGEGGRGGWGHGPPGTNSGQRTDQPPRGLDRIAAGVRPVIDTVYGLDDFRAGVERLERRDVFGKILVEL